MTVREQELAYLDRLEREGFLDQERYTTLAGRTERARPTIRNIYEKRLRPYDDLGVARILSANDGPARFENAVEEMLRLRRAVLLGDPGGGKTTTFWNLAAKLTSEARIDAAAPLPVFVRLGEWLEPEKSLADFIQGRILLPGQSLRQLLDQRRAALLLDGMNELPAGQRKDKYPQIARLLEDEPDILAFVSCRELDYTTDLGLHRIVITQLDPIRIAEFANLYLGEELGKSLFRRLAGEAALETFEQFMKAVGGQLTDPREVFWMGNLLPSGVRWGRDWRGEDDNSQWEEWLTRRDHPSSLLTLSRNPFILTMFCEVYREFRRLPDNRGDLFRTFVDFLLANEKRRSQPDDEEESALITGLEELAYQMQIRRTADGSDPKAGVLTALPRSEVEAILKDRLLYLARSASIIRGDEEVRFAHQLLQEYFAARYIKREIEEKRLKSTAIWPVGSWWERTGWEEAVKLLAGLYTNDSTPAVDWVATANPEVAAQCVEFSGAAINPETLQRLKSDWIDRVANLRTDPNPQARAAIGRALGLTGLDDRVGVGVVERRLEDGQIVRLPNFDFVEIPEGFFRFGEWRWRILPPKKQWLPGFNISRYPVTAAQFQAFIDDPEGASRPERWFAGLAADDDDRVIQDQENRVEGRDYANHPRENINWYQAIAFCRWLSWRLGGGYDLARIDLWKVRLPTEFEWEKAARGTSGRIYPYGNWFDRNKANTRETGIRQTTAVGIFPHGQSPYGVMDMSGNVWEWCLGNYRNSQRDPGSENLTNDDLRLVRGGSWYSLPDVARAAFRNYSLPADRLDDYGFRVVCGMRPPSLDH